jgi:hypothetical protein
MTLKTRLTRLEAIINSALIEEGTTNNGTDAKKENVCDKE